MPSELRFRPGVRALLVDELDEVLLVRFVFPSGVEAWALPGGGLEDGESVEAGLRRELHEELGITGFELGPHIWTREHIVPMRTGHDGQRDRIHLVRVDHFEPHPTIGWAQLRSEFVFDMAWWSLDRIRAATDTRFVPRRLPDLLMRLLAEGPPSRPIDTGV